MDAKAVSHQTSLGSEEKELQSSPKILETVMHVPFRLQCWDVIAKLRGYNNIAKGRGKTKGSRIFQSASRFLSKIVWSGMKFSEDAQEMLNKTLTFLVATTCRPCIFNVSCNDDVHVCWSSISFVNFFFWTWEEKVKCLRRRVVFKRNFHLKGSECIRAEFAVVSCCVALEQCNCARTCKDLAQEMSLLEQPIYRSSFSSIRVISEGTC